MTVSNKPENAEIAMYVTTSAALGLDRGVWIDCALDWDDVEEMINDMVADSPAAAQGSPVMIEHMHGVQKLPKMSINPKEFWHVANFVAEFPKFGRELLANFGGDVGQCREAAANFIGIYDSERDYARSLWAEDGDVPGYAKRYLDYDMIAKDMVGNGAAMFIDIPIMKVAVFSPA